MVKIRGQGSVKRLGSRYGRKVRHKLQQVEIEQKRKSKCPYCNYAKVKRLSAGIYTCTKCKAKFTGRAYNIVKEVRVKEEVAAPDEEVVETSEEDDQDYQDEETDQSQS